MHKPFAFLFLSFVLALPASADRYRYGRDYYPTRSETVLVFNASDQKFACRPLSSVYDSLMAKARAQDRKAIRAEHEGKSKSAQRHRDKAAMRRAQATPPPLGRGEECSTTGRWIEYRRGSVRMAIALIIYKGDKPWDVMEVSAEVEPYAVDAWVARITDEVIECKLSGTCRSSTGESAPSVVKEGEGRGEQTRRCTSGIGALYPKLCKSGGS